MLWICLLHFFTGENHPPPFARNVYECLKCGLFLCIECQNSLSLSCPGSNQLSFEIQVIFLLLGTGSEPGFGGLKKPDFCRQPTSEAEGHGSSLVRSLKHQQTSWCPSAMWWVSFPVSLFHRNCLKYYMVAWIPCGVS